MQDSPVVRHPPTPQEQLATQSNRSALAAAGTTMQRQLQGPDDAAEASTSSPLMLQAGMTLPGALDALAEHTRQLQSDLERESLRLDGNAPTAQEAYYHTLTPFASTMQEFQQFCTKHNALPAPSASAGYTLKQPNDHAGILIVGVEHGRYLMYEQLVLVDTKIPVKTSPGADDRLETHRFVLGDDQHPIPLDELDHAIEQVNAANSASIKGKNKADAAKAGADEMETPFRTQRKRLARAAPLRLRENIKESTDMFVDARLGAKKMANKKMWANSTHAMPQGVGRVDENGVYDFYMSDDAVENTWNIFQHLPSKPLKVPKGPDGKPRAFQAEGPVIACFEGIAHIDVMGPKGQEESVKAAKLSVRQLMAYFRDLETSVERRDVTLLLTMEDRSIHQVVFGDNGLWIKLRNPKALLEKGPAAAFGHFQGAGDGRPEIFTYSYDGGDNGLEGSESGHAEPQLVVPGGSRLPAGPFLLGPAGAGVARTTNDFLVSKLGADQGGAVLRLFTQMTEAISGNVIASTRLIANVATGNPVFAGGRGGVTEATNKLVSAVVSGALVMVMNTLLEALPHEKSGARFGGTHGFSAAGGGKKVSPGIIFLAIASMAIVQNSLTVLYRALGYFVPAGLTKRDTKVQILLNDVLLPTLPEMARLSASMLVQMGFHFSRGSGGDIGMLAAQSLGNAALDNFLGRRIGEPANNVILENLRLTGRFLLETATRGAGNSYSSPEYNPAHVTANMREGMITRMITHGPYKLLMPIIGNMLNYFGTTGPNAGAYYGQVSRSGAALFNLPELLIGVGDAGLAKADSLLQKSADQVGLTELVKVCNSFFDDVQRHGNRVLLRSKGPIQSELDDVDAAIRAQKAEPGEAEEHERGLDAKMQQMVLDSQAGKAAQGGPTAMRSNRRQLPKGSAKFMRELDRQQQLNSSDEAQAALGHIPYPVKVSHDGRTRPTGGKKSTPLSLHDSATIPLNATTWSETAQEFALPTHNRMLNALGLNDMRLPDGSELPRLLKLETLDYIVKYTFNSGPFHYGLRWDKTGQKFRQTIVEGIKLELQAINRRGHTEGASPWRRTGGADFYHPIGALYINLAIRCSPKFSAIVQRAVGPEAPYLTADPGDDSVHVKPGDLVMLTEVLSSTMSSRLAAAFGQALGFGSLPEERSVKLAIRTRAVVITPKTDLGQAESLNPPGTMYRVRHIDPTPPPPELAPGEEADLATQISRVAYMEEADTVEMEQRYLDFEKGKLGPKDDGLEMLHPVSGHLYRYDGRNDEAVYDNAIKSYYLGTKMETPTLTTEKARWRHPFNSDYAPRITKDAINAAMSDKESAIRAYLDWASENAPHEERRIKQGFYSTEDGKAMLEARKTVKAEARKIADIYAALPGDAADRLPNGQPGELLAWTVMNMLRLPIDMFGVDEHGHVDLDNPTRLNRTYDKVPVDDRRAIAVGVGADGYYIIRPEGGEARAFKVEAGGTGHSAGNLLHVINYRAYAAHQQYEQLTLADGRPGLKPDERARDTVRDLTAELKDYASVSSYAVWLDGLTGKYDELGGNDSATVKKKGKEKDKV
ncbi:hypothetical protein [Herbaspirillum sp. RV1423]|uniref:hypothetical protein n=1 Tax=Herbaspirillum sp. RV1423 TaxID=1443993 RepID=UPI0004BAC953|nr:hypothetical protein [Herbaspirillum sp. RV1423]